MNEKEMLELEKAISDAEKYSMRHKDSEDGGTCNFDTPMVYVKATPKQMACIEWSTLKHGKRHPDGGTWYLVYTKLYGQGNRRTRMAEAVAKRLKELGYTSSVFYMID